MHTETHIDTHITIRSNVSNEETKKQTKLIERKQQNTYIKQRPLNEGWIKMKRGNDDEWERKREENH